MFLLHLCTVCHVHLMHHSLAVHFFCCALPPSSLVNPTQQQHLISSLFCILIVSVHLVHAILPCSASSHNPNSPHRGVFSTSLFHNYPFTMCHTVSSVLHLLLIVSALPDHHGNSSASLAVSPTHPSSLGVMLRFLSFSGS
jgi:hypothetical protein